MMNSSWLLKIFVLIFSEDAFGEITFQTNLYVTKKLGSATKTEMKAFIGIIILMVGIKKLPSV